MGKVRRLLHSQELAEPRPEHYADKATYELSESMHWHRRNLRIEMSPQEFRGHLDQTRRAGESWAQHDQEPPSPGRPTLYLDLADIPPVPGESPRRFDIEESEYPTIPEGTVHLHYRDLRIELSPQEWEEFSDGVIAARKAWDESR